MCWILVFLCLKVYVFVKKKPAVFARCPLPDQAGQEWFRDVVLTVFFNVETVTFCLIEKKKVFMFLVSFDYFNKWLVLPSLFKC